MRILAALAVIIVTFGVGACFWHHKEQVVVEPIAGPMK